MFPENILMTVVKNYEQIERMRISGALLSECLDMLKEAAVPGVSGLILDQLAEEFIRDHGAKPAFKGYASMPEVPGFPGSICFSRNHVLVHGIPRADDFITEGDIITIDCGLSLNDWFADAARLFGVADITEENHRLIEASKEALDVGINKCRAGNKLGDICNAIQISIDQNKYHNVYQFCGHAIGKKMHEPPQVPNYGKAGEGLVLEPGMVFCLEPMLLKHKTKLGILSDNWTVITVDKSTAAHIEHMVLVTERDPEVLTASN